MFHSGLFIPSTLNGSCVKENGKVNQSVLHQNLNSAIDIYIERCNGCSCGKTVIHLFKGVPADYERRGKLITFLKGTKKKKLQLKEEHPALYKHLVQFGIYVIDTWYQGYLLSMYSSFVAAC